MAPTLLRPPFMTGGWGSPKIDLAGCVLYLPLWRPDMAGDTIISKDIYGHVCTVTEALWTPYGRDFDGTNDYIDCGTNVAAMPDVFSLEAWVKWGGLNDSAHIVGWNTGAGGGLYIYYYAADLTYLALAGNNYRRWDQSPVDPLDGEWHHMVATLPGSGQSDMDNSILYADGQVQTINSTVTTGAQSAKTRIYIGGNTSKYTDGLIGEVRIYNRVLTLQEVNRNYQATKWRYQ